MENFTNNRVNVLFISRVTPNLNGSGVERRCARHIIALSKIQNLHLLIFNRADNTIS